MLSLHWSKHLDALPAIPVGTHGLVVLDCDRKADGPDGVRAFEALCKHEGIDLRESFAISTPSGGVHFYFATAVAYGNSSGSLPDGIDVRGKGGYVIGPGATLPDGRSYRLAYGEWDAIPALPDALAKYLRPKLPLREPDAPAAPTASQRDLEYAAVALESELNKLRSLKAGGRRNAALNKTAHSLGTLAANGFLDPQSTAQALYAAAVANGHVAKHGEHQTRATIESGLRAGMAKPRGSIACIGPEIDVQAIISKGLTRQRSIPHKAASRSSVALIQGSEIEPKPIHWLWDGYLPAGKLTLLAGAGGTGKSTIAFSLAGIISNAGIWPDGTKCKSPGNVLIWSSEDDPSDTIKPRLMAVGANQHRYGVVSGTTDENGASRPFDAATDMIALREAVERIGGISLLVIDPIVSAVAGDMHKANDVRRSLQSIVDFAADCDCAVLGITHFAKGTAGKNSAERVIGSQAFAALARMVLVAAKEEESDRRVFTRAKSNNSIDSGGFSYTIETVNLEKGIITTRVAWGEALEGSSRSILNGVEGEQNEDTTKRGMAKRYLLAVLANGPVPSRELFEDALEKYSISRDTLRRAQSDLGIIAHKAHFTGGWTWSLPFVGKSPAKSD